MRKERSGISCPTFVKQETAIKNITDKLNRAKGAREKAVFAEELQKEAAVLAACPDYNDAEFACTNCRSIADLRVKTAGLVIRFTNPHGGRGG